MNPTYRPDQISRRQLLQIGGIGILGLGLPELLQAGAPARGSRTSAKSCIFIVQYGGCSHHDTFDLKPEAPADVRGPYKPIATTVPGVRIGELLPRLGGLAHRYCLVRSMTHRDGGHDGGMHVCMTGHSSPTPETPYFGSVMAKLRPATRNIPSYVWLQNLAGDVRPYYLTGGFLGAAYSPLRVGQDLDNPSNPNFKVTALDPPADIPAPRLHERQERRRVFGESFWRQCAFDGCKVFANVPYIFGARTSFPQSGIQLCALAPDGNTGTRLHGLHKPRPFLANHALNPGRRSVDD